MSEVAQDGPAVVEAVTTVQPVEESHIPVSENAESTHETPAASPQPEAQPAVEPVKDVHPEPPTQTEVAPESNSQATEKPAEAPPAEPEKPVVEATTEAPASPKKEETADKPSGGWQSGSPQKALSVSGGSQSSTDAPSSPRKTDDAPKKACIGEHHAEDTTKPVETETHHEPHEPEKEVRGILVHPGERKNKNTAGVHMTFDEPKREGPPSANKAKFAERKIEGKEGLVAKKKAQEGMILRRRLDSDPAEPSPVAPAAVIEPLASPHTSSTGEHKKKDGKLDKADKEKKKADNKKKGKSSLCTPCFLELVIT
jgi:hypothetical protein